MKQTNSTLWKCFRIRPRIEPQLKPDLAETVTRAYLGAMPRRRPKIFLEKLGSRIRARRLYVARTMTYVANECEISVSQLAMYETGGGHPPAATLHRIAMSLGTSSSELMGEKIKGETLEQLDVLVRLYTDPMIGVVTRHMQDMTVDERRAMSRIAVAIASRAAPETVKVMK